MSERTEVHLSEIVDSRWQTRKHGYSGSEFDELVASVKEHGVITPPGVFPNENGEWELIYGHRRVAAARKAKFVLIPVTVHIGPGPEMAELDQELLDRYQQRVLADNLHHQDLTPLETARALQDLIEQQGLSQAEVGKLYGKSQQWVSDHVALLGLAEPVQQALTERAVEKTVARALAKLPEDYQKPVLEYVKKMSSRDAEEAIKDIEKATDPAFWDLPEGEPVDPEHYNIKLMVDDCLDEVQEGKMPETVVKLHNGYDLLKPPGEQIAHWMSQFARPCIGEAKTLSQWLVEHGRTCEECVFQGLGLHWQCDKRKDETCESFIGPDDPVRLPPPATKECKECTEERKSPICEDLGCYIEQKKKDRQAREEQRGEEDLDREIAAMERLRAFYDRQLQEDVDNNHWLAQPCEACKAFRAGELRDQCGLEEPRRALTSLWQNGEVIVPRCSQYQLRDLNRIPEIDQSHFEEMLLAWIGKGQLHALDWVCEGQATVAKIEKLNLGKKRLCALMCYELSRILWPNEELHTISPLTGGQEKWKKVEEKATTEESG